MLALLFTVLCLYTLLFLPPAIGSNTGWIIDLFCQHGGEGPNVAASPPFIVGDVITLYASITYNQEPVQAVLVAFQVNNPLGYPYLVTTAQTNASGIATTSFAITENVYPTFPSTWQSIATASPAQHSIEDTMSILVLPRPVTPPPPPPSPPLGGISSVISASALETYVRVLIAEILIGSVAVAVLTRFRIIFSADRRLKA